VDEGQTEATNDGVVEAGRAIRPYLVELVGPAAGDFDERIAHLLNSGGPSNELATALRDLLNGHEATSAFLEAVLFDAPQYRPPAVQSDYVRSRGYQGPPGEVGVVLHAGKYVCPYGDFVWYRPSVGTDIEECPTHGPGLVRT
jgi:hypothetical protein